MYSIFAFLLLGAAHATSPRPPTAHDMICYDTTKRSNLQFQLSTRYENESGSNHIFVGVKTYDDGTGRSIGWAQAGSAHFNMKTQEGEATNRKGESIRIESLNHRLNQDLSAKPRFLDLGYTPSAWFYEVQLESGDTEYPILVVRATRAAKGMSVAVIRAQKGSSWVEQLQREQDDLDRTGRTGGLRLVQEITTYDLKCEDDASYRTDIPVLIR